MEERKMTRAEAAAKGRPNALKATLARHQKRVDAYNANPTTCKSCSHILPYNQRKGKFCSHTCAAQFNNKGVRRHGEAPSDCLNCGKHLEASAKKFCSQKCFHDFEFEQNIAKWLQGEVSGVTCNGDEVSSFIRRWLVKTKGRKCSICGIEQWQDQPVPLVLDHIDGHSDNCRPENVRLICRNCDGLLPTFSGKNKGNGRKHRKSMRQSKM